LTKDAVRLLRYGRPDAAFVYLGSVDMTGHGWGAMSNEYVDMVLAADGCLGQLLGAIDRRPSREAERWLTMVTTDYGHRDGGFNDEERCTFVLYEGDGVEPGVRDDARMVDIAATALAHLGLEIPAGLDGTSLTSGTPTIVS